MPENENTSPEYVALSLNDYGSAWALLKASRRSKLSGDEFTILDHIITSYLAGNPVTAHLYEQYTGILVERGRRKGGRIS